jgi:hypothetical protein
MELNERQIERVDRVDQHRLRPHGGIPVRTHWTAVILDVSEVSIHPIHDLHTALAGFVSGEVATVHQIFTDPSPAMRCYCLITRLP